MESKEKSQCYSTPQKCPIKRCKHYFYKRCDKYYHMKRYHPDIKGDTRKLMKNRVIC